MRSAVSAALAASSLALTLAATQAAAQRGPGPAGPPPSAQASAQADLTGYWVALVTEDWLWRMITPPKGDATSVPLNMQGRAVAEQWDPARDAASAEQCRPFGAAGLMRMPLRLHVTWADENTLSIETDAGEQTRLLHFDAATTAPAERSWQGFSRARWTQPPPGGFDLRVALGGPPPGPAGPPKGSVKAVTTQLLAGYLRKNGLPYSENAELTEYFSRVSAFDHEYLTVLTIVHDPMYLATDFVTSSQFKREPDDARWNPSPCRTAPPLASAGD
jgi:hypothetical protein